MELVIIILIILSFSFLVYDFYEKKQKKKIAEQLNQNWGEPKKNVYFNFDLISRYFFNSTRNKDGYYQIIDDTVCNDLDINSLFEFIDRTSSKIGQQYLYAKLRTPTNSVNNLKQFDKLVESFTQDPSGRKNCQMALHKLNSSNAYYFEELIFNDSINKPKFLTLLYILTILSIAILFFSIIKPILILLLLPIFLVNMFYHYRNKRNIQFYLIGVSQLLKIIKATKQLSKIKTTHNHFGKPEFLKKINGLKLKAKFISFERQIGGDAAQIVWAIIELFKIMFNLETIIFFRFIDQILKERSNLISLLEYIGEIDAAISTASLRHGLKYYSKPEFLNKKKIQFKDIIHPLITDCIPNDLSLNHKSMLLTGSNMAGKTSFIRAVGLNAVMAQSIFTCFAKEYFAPIFKIHSSIRISDDILENTSYYLKEVLTIKSILAESDKKEACLFILDELFKGTNTAERISAGKSILSFLNKKNHIVMVSTHDNELTELLTDDNFENYHFKEHIENNQLLFDHKLKMGALKTRNAIKILEIYNYDQQIIEDANETLNKIENQNSKV